MKISQVDKFKKGLDDTQKKEYVALVKAETSKLLKDGVDGLQSEIQAIRKANSMFGDTSKSMQYSEFKEKGITVTLAEVADDDFQLVLPIGTSHDSYYGELVFTESFMKAMVANKESLKNTVPFLNEQHDRGKACAWLSDMRVSDDGLEVKWDFTELGSDLVQGKIYKYYSAEIGSVTDIDNGANVFPVFRGCALTNSPVMKNLPEVHLQEVTFQEQNGGKEVNFTAIMEALKALTLSDDDKSTLMEAYGEQSSEDVNLSEQIIAKDEVITSLNTEISGLKEKIALTEANKVEVKLAEAMEAGLIKPVDKEKWEARLSDNFEVFSEILDEMTPAVDLEEHGSEGDEGEKGITLKFDSKDFTGSKGINTSGSLNSKDFT